MARAWKVSGLRPDMSVGAVARRVLAVRIAEIYSFAPFIHDPARVTELHDMRIAAKRLRYTLELFKVGYPPAAGEVLERTKELQELLGEIHDADVLAPILIERLTAIAAEEQAALVTRLSDEPDEAARADLIRSALAPAADRRVGLYALLGRTAQRRRKRYAQFLEQWAQLEARGFRAELEALTRRPAAEATLAVPMPDAASAAE
ncbi:MAG: CHAD domain-containing protein [Chloroflexi bacterium]|nr:CHAD domain-containing protein [Chloroflexota bacterium]